MSENREYISQIRDNGSLHISEEVIASIAGLAMMEVDGVGSLNSGFGNELADMIGKKNFGKGVRITIGEDNEICIDCAIVVKLGQSIVEVAQNVQEAVCSNVESVTGCKVTAVNVTVVGIALPKETKR